MWLESSTFSQVIACTPLVSMDLVVRNPDRKILLGKRVNRPAQGFWFVPGGRIQKNETLDQAFERLTLEELGKPVPRSRAKLLDIYEHFYTDSVFGEAPDTHYVVAGYLLDVVVDGEFSPSFEQHEGYHWWTPDDMRNDPLVHDNTRAYLDAAEKIIPS